MSSPNNRHIAGISQLEETFALSTRSKSHFWSFFWFKKGTGAFSPVPFLQVDYLQGSCSDSMGGTVWNPGETTGALGSPRC